MKSVKTFAYMMAMAIVCTAGMVSCKDKEEPQDPTQQTGEPGYAGQVVKTQFAIALPGQIGSSSVNRMPSATVQNAGLSQFQGITDLTLIPFAKQGAIATTDTRLGTNIVLSGDVATADLESDAANAKLYENVDIPLTTASFLFYAKSKATGTGFEVGALTPTMTGTTPASYHFDLQPMVTDVDALYLTSAAGGKLMQYLTHVACASDGLTEPKRWYEYTADSAAMYAMFNTFTSMHGLSSFEVARVLTDLNKSLKPLTNSPIAKAIRDSIASPTYATINGSDEVVLKSELSHFPGQYKLPDGAVDIKWNSSSHAFEKGLYNNMAALNTYVYPAQLWYFVNSTIKTSNTSKKTMYDGTKDWTAILAAHTDGAAVNSLTRAVAIKDTIQYAVARLDVQVRLASASMADNSDLAEGLAKAVDATAGFPVTAILVGGQKNVGFDFTPITSTEYTIYDSVMASTAETLSPATMMAMPGSGYSAMNHTLVLENGTEDVMVAVEMLNTTGVDFYGVGNQLIPKNGKFYVIAKLEKAAATETGNHVFKQDYTTTAKLTLTNLKKAYNTIPDLRTPKMELGFTVDLSWKAGHTYEIEF